jgi:hypothetical protein
MSSTGIGVGAFDAAAGSSWRVLSGRLKGWYQHRLSSSTGAFQKGILHGSCKWLNPRHRHRLILPFQNQVLLESWRTYS